MHEPEFLTEIPSFPSQCAYLPEQTAYMPLSLPAGSLSAEQADAVLALGYRRSGWFYYRTRCPACSACEPVRINVETLQPTRSQRRALKKGDAVLRCEIQEPSVDNRRLELFNAHRQTRGLAAGDDAIDEAGYRSFLVHSHIEVWELGIYLDDQLVAVAICDVAQLSLSAVYCYFDPDYSRLSLGTYAIMRQWQLAAQTGRRWLYLGMFVAANRHLSYKARFTPHQRWINSHWQTFGKDDAGLRDLEA